MNGQKCYEKKNIIYSTTIKDTYTYIDYHIYKGVLHLKTSRGVVICGERKK